LFVFGVLGGVGLVRLWSLGRHSSLGRLEASLAASVLGVFGVGCGVGLGRCVDLGRFVGHGRRRSWASRASSVVGVFRFLWLLGGRRAASVLGVFGVLVLGDFSVLGPLYYASWVLGGVNVGSL
jgi:hypothetical protein